MSTVKKFTLAEAKPIVRKSLKLSESLDDFWTVSLPKNDNAPLALAHYTMQPRGFDDTNNEYFEPENRSQKVLINVRGKIVDLETGLLIADTTGFIRSLPIYSPIIKKEDGSYSFTGMKISYIRSEKDDPTEVPKKAIGECFLGSDSEFRLAYEGVVLHFFKYRGKVRVSTHRNIDATNSAWGSSDKFMDLYYELGGPDPKEFFGDEPTSPFTHIILVAHNQLRISSTTRDNRLVYIGSRKCWDEKIHAAKGGVYEYEGDIKLVTPVFKKLDTELFSSGDLRQSIHEPKLSTVLANKVLFPHKFAKDAPKDAPLEDYQLVVEYDKEGKKAVEVYTKKYNMKVDERLTGGDPLLVYTKNSEGETVLYRLEPVGFNFRIGVTRDEHNFYLTFVEGIREFTVSEPKDLRRDYPQFADTDGSPIDLTRPRSRQELWYNIFIYCVAPAHREMVKTFLEKYSKDISEVAKFIMGEFKHLKDDVEKKFINPKSVIRMNSLLEFAEKSQSKYKSLIYLLHNETGKSMYRMIAIVNRIKRYRARKAKEQES